VGWNGFDSFVRGQLSVVSCPLMAGEGGEKLFLELVEVFVGLGVVFGEEGL